MIGGRAVFSSATENVKFESHQSLTVIAEAALEFLVGITSRTVTGETINKFLHSSTSSLTSLGGRPGLAAKIEKGEFSEWADSVKGSYQTLVDFGPTDLAMHPIWEVCSDSFRKAELIAAYPDYATSKQIIFTSEVDQIFQYGQETNDGIWQHLFSSNAGVNLESKWRPSEFKTVENPANVAFVAPTINEVATEEAVPVYVYVSSPFGGVDRSYFYTTNPVQPHGLSVPTESPFEHSNIAFYAFTEMADGRAPVYQYCYNEYSQFMF